VKVVSKVKCCVIPGGGGGGVDDPVNIRITDRDITRHNMTYRITKEPRSI
jgi:hypothetical protein